MKLNVASEPLVLPLDNLNAALDILSTRQYRFGNFSVESIRFDYLYGLHTRYHQLARYSPLKSFIFNSFHVFEIIDLPFLLEKHIVDLSTWLKTLYSI
jgi:hypothetical protein